MNPANGKKIYFIGIGGVGMAPLAALTRLSDARVDGSDLAESAKCARLRELGVTVKIGHAAENVPADTTLAVISSAVAPDNPEWRRVVEAGIPVLRRGEYLARYLADYRRVAAVSGAHGKTSITAMLGWILRGTTARSGYLFGGEVRGVPSWAAGDGDIFVTEADESDGTHTALSGWLAIVPNVDDDHAWSVGGEERLRENFRSFASHFQRVIYLASPTCDALFADHAGARRVDEATLTAAGTGLPETWVGFERRNGALAVLAAAELGVARAAAYRALADFPGVERRLSERAADATRQTVLVEDYAHHPEELAQALEALRQRYGQYRLHVVFQPHRFQRLERYFDVLATVLATVDRAWVAPVFAAWSERGARDGAALAAAVTARGGHATALERDWAAAAAAVTAGATDGGGKSLIAVIGAGDVAELVPEIGKILKKR